MISSRQSVLLASISHHILCVPTRDSQEEGLVGWRRIVVQDHLFFFLVLASLVVSGEVLIIEIVLGWWCC